MRYWWVNQNQTYRQEIGGGYLWSPKRNADGAFNPFYEFMREVSPGDVVFSFVDTRIVAVGIASSNCYECPKPPEFGGVGAYWNLVGWKVRVIFTRVDNKLRPKDHIEILGPMLPAKYSPIRLSGGGNQIYLAEISVALGQTLAGLIGRQAQEIINFASLPSEISRPIGEVADIEVWEHHIEQTIETAEIPETERQALIVARRGQGLFKERVLRIEKQCVSPRWTGLNI